MHTVRLQILQLEGGGMEAAFQKIGGVDYHPSLTQVVVLKRHTARFFPKNLNPSARPAVCAPVLLCADSSSDANVHGCLGAEYPVRNGG